MSQCPQRLAFQRWCTLRIRCCQCYPVSVVLYAGRRPQLLRRAGTAHRRSSASPDVSHVLFRLLVASVSQISARWVWSGILKLGLVLGLVLAMVGSLPTLPRPTSAILLPFRRPTLCFVATLSPSSFSIMAVASRRLAKELQDIMTNGMPTGQGYQSCDSQSDMPLILFYPGITLLKADTFDEWFIQVEILGESLYVVRLDWCRYRYHPQ
jgi:hypothetical protein